MHMYLPPPTPPPSLSLNKCEQESSGSLSIQNYLLYGISFTDVFKYPNYNSIKYICSHAFLYKSFVQAVP